MNKGTELEGKSDEELMEIYKAGESLAFDLIYHRYVGRILVYMNKRIASKEKAQDLTQEVFLKLHRSREQYNKMLPLAPWIFSITRSVSLDYLKKKNLEIATEPGEFDHIPSPDTVTKGSSGGVMGEDEGVLKGLSGFDQLPDQQRQAVALRVLDEATFDEIAERLATSPANARQLFSRGIRKLKSSLGGKET